VGQKTTKNSGIIKIWMNFNSFNIKYKTLQRKWKKLTQAVFLGPFSICWQGKLKFNVCQFASGLRNRSNPLATDLKNLSKLAQAQL
jgi:hypothetical protein